MRSERVVTQLGPLPADWSVRPLGEVTKRIVREVQVEPSQEYREIGIRSHGKGIFHKEPIKGESLGGKRVFQVVTNSLVFNIVFAWEGAVAVTSEREEGMIASHRFPMFGPTEQQLIDVDFLRRFFQTELGVRLLAEASPGGAGRNRTLNQKFAAQIPVPVPPFGEQKKIAAILSSVDEAIEATQAVIDQLQVVKKAMMAELLTRGLPGRHTRFKQTEIGEVPEEWHIVALGDLIEKGPDNGLYKPQSAYGRGTPIVRIDAFENGEVLKCEGLRLVQISPEELARFRLSKGDILINRVNSLTHLAKVALVVDPPEDTVFESNMMRLAVDESRVCPAFIFRVIASPRSKEFFLSRAKQAVAQASINQQDVRALPVPLPGRSEQEDIAALFERLDERVGREEEKLAGLGNLKTALMSALLTGEVRVKLDEEAA